MASELSRPWLDRPASTHPLLKRLADSQSFIGVQGSEEVLRVVFAAYATFAASRDWDPQPAPRRSTRQLSRHAHGSADSSGRQAPLTSSTASSPAQCSTSTGAQSALTFASATPTMTDAQSRPSPRASRSSAARLAAGAVHPSSPAVPDRLGNCRLEVARGGLNQEPPLGTCVISGGAALPTRTPLSGPGLLAETSRVRPEIRCPAPFPIIRGRAVKRPESQHLQPLLQSGRRVSNPRPSAWEAEPLR
jgi:hypothetical protein